MRERLIALSVKPEPFIGTWVWLDDEEVWEIRPSGVGDGHVGLRMEHDEGRFIPLIEGQNETLRYVERVRIEVGPKFDSPGITIVAVSTAEMLKEAV